MPTPIQAQVLPTPPKISQPVIFLREGCSLVFTFHLAGARVFACPCRVAASGTRLWLRGFQARQNIFEFVMSNTIANA